MDIKIRKLNDNAVIPSYAKPGDAGLDLTAVSIEVVDKHKEYGYISYGSGLAFEIPEGYVGYIFPRSSISNTGLILSNAVGVIDSGYRGEVTARFKYIEGTNKYGVGDRFAQLIIMPVPKVNLIEVTELSTTERGEGGHGSTGN